MSANSFANSKRVAKNTVLLYVRMIAVMLVSLVTVKYTLQLLGEQDYGIVNVVGGVVTFMTFITTTITLATNRFLAFELGHRDGKNYNDTFNMLLLVFLVAGISIVAILELLSYPLTYHWLQIPDARRDAAFVVFHLSTLSFLANIMGVPFMSSILANEKMGVYAYVTILETVARLLVLLVLVMTSYDRLVVYALCTLLITMATSLIYCAYNARHVEDTRIYFFWDKGMFRQLTGYTGWSLFATISNVMCTQGVSILMNLFFGVTVNAAKAIADKIKNIIQSFVTNFYVAVSPQITKTYAAGEVHNTIKLAYSSTRLAFYLMMLLSLPAIILMDDLLHLWLGDTCSVDMVVFTRLSLVFTIVTVFESPITFMVRATGDIKRYQIYVGVITLLVVPLSYVVFLMGFPAYMAFVVEIVVYAVVQFIRVHVAKRFFDITIWGYVVDVLVRPCHVTIVTLVMAVLLWLTTSNAWVTAVLTTATLGIAIWMMGLMKNEKKMVVDFVAGKLKSIKR